jgi:hypothetical protein
MLATLSDRISWLSIVRLWWWRIHTQRQAAIRPREAVRAYTGVPRRYPIPAGRAYLYARAADESFGG